MTKKFIIMIMLIAAALFNSYGVSEEVGRVSEIDRRTGDVTVTVISGLRVNMGDRLQVETSDGKIVLEVTFPMLTLSKCKIRGKGKLSQLSKGMKVYRYSKDEPVEDTAVKPGKTKKFGNMEFVSIPGGTYIMGSPESEKGRDSDEKQHEVTVSPFWMGKYEVTQKQYREIMGTNPSNFKGDNLPVENVSWEDATDFCKKFSAKYNVKARLPYEAEWEYACRAGTATAYYWGNTMDGDYLWYSSNSGNKTHPVGEKKPNAFGLYDMSGNVFEWCMDWYDEEYFAKSPSKNPQGALNGIFRVFRGGSWPDYFDDLLRSAVRLKFYPGFRNHLSGFRVVVFAN